MGNENILNKLKDEYKWELHIPHEINDGFKLTPELLEHILIMNFAAGRYQKKAKTIISLLRAFESLL